MSRHLHSHPVGYFISGFVREHDPEQVELHAYSSSRPDWLTGMLQEATEHWVEIGEASDGELARRIVHDGIDILFDAAGLLRAARGTAADARGWDGGVRLLQQPIEAERCDPGTLG